MKTHAFQTSQGSFGYPRVDFIFVYTLQKYELDELVRLEDGLVKVDKEALLAELVKQREELEEVGKKLFNLPEYDDDEDWYLDEDDLEEIRSGELRRQANEWYERVLGVKNGERTSESAIVLSDGFSLHKPDLLHKIVERGSRSNFDFELKYPNGAVDFAYVAHAGYFVPELMQQRGITKKDRDVLYEFINRCIPQFATAHNGSPAALAMVLEIRYMKNREKPDMYELAQLLSVEKVGEQSGNSTSETYRLQAEDFVKHLVEYHRAIAEVRIDYDDKILESAEWLKDALVDLSSVSRAKFNWLSIW